MSQTIRSIRRVVPLSNLYLQMYGNTDHLNFSRRLAKQGFHLRLPALPVCGITQMH